MSENGTVVMENSWNDKWSASVEIPWVGCRIMEADSEQEALEMAASMEAAIAKER